MAKNYEIGDIGVRFAKHTGGGSQSLQVPSGLSFWKPKKSGSHNIDIVPYVVTNVSKRFADNLVFVPPGKLWYERSFFSHRSIGVNEDSFVCPAKTANRPCPICEGARKYQDSPRKEDQEARKALRPQERQLFLIYDLDDPDRGIQIWNVSTFNFGAQLDEFIRGARTKNVAAYRKFFAPGGFSMRITGVEKPMPSGTNTVYSVNEFYERENPWPENFLEHGYDLDAMVRVLDYKDLKAIYEGTHEPDDDDDELPADGEEATHEEPPLPARPAPRASASTPRNGPAKPSASAPKKEEEKPADEPQQFATGDLVEFDYRDDRVRGSVTKVFFDKRVAHILPEGGDKPVIRDFEDLTLVKSDDTFDLKDAPADDEPSPPAKGKKGAEVDKWATEDDQDNRVRTPGKRK